MFKTVAEAFNYYRTFTNEQLEKRAQELKAMIETDPDVDIKSMNIELTAISEAKENNDNKQTDPAPEPRNNPLNVITRQENNGQTIDPENASASPEYRSAFYKTLLGRELTQAEKRAFNAVVEKRDSFNNAGNSSAILPQQTLNEIIEQARTEGGLLAECRAFNMPVKIAIPIGTPATKASWHTEGEEAETQSADTVKVDFDGHEIIKIFSISKKVEKMSVDAFEAYLVKELESCVMECINSAIIDGTGSGQGTGLETGITWTDKKNLKKLTTAPSYTDFCNFVAMQKRGYSKGAKFAMNNATLYSRLYGIVDDNGRPIIIADPKAENVGKMLGFEIIIDDNIQDDVIYFGNFSKYYGYNIADGITLEKSTESSFKKNLIDFKASAVADCKPLVTEAFIKMSIEVA